jgi:hypothetical protein
MQAQLLLCELFRTIREQSGRHKELSCHASILLWPLGSNKWAGPLRMCFLSKGPNATSATRRGSNDQRLQWLATCCKNYQA